MSEEDSHEARIRPLLPHTWHPFFARFGRLTPIQHQAIPALVRGASLLISAPTAAGKTEALIAPIVERLLPRPGNHLKVLLIAPTRALCNDLHRRISRPLERCHITLDRKTGDAKTFSPARPPHVLITTPESLDSLLTRHPKILRHIDTVALDELHLLARSPRGDQLRCLLARLDALAADAPPRRAAASATLPDAEGLARTFLGPDARVLSDQRSPRRIEATTAHAATLDAVVDALRDLHRAAPGHKILVFANTRAQVEQITARLPEAIGPQILVFAHHGSLARAERLRVERRFLRERAAICVATMTLELGIDIGDIDRVVLVAPPPNVSSLLQRVGRGNRAHDTTHVLCLFDGDLELARFHHLLTCARAGRLFPDPVQFRPTLLAQQALSLLFQNPKRWVSASALRKRLPPALAARFSEAQILTVLRSLVEHDYLRALDAGRFTAEPRSEKLFELGLVHSVIDSPPEIEVVDALTGRSIGQLPLGPRTRAALSSGRADSIALGGRSRQVARVTNDQVFVEGHSESGARLFEAREAPRYAFELAQDFAAFLDLPPRAMMLEYLPDGTWRLGHFLGTLWGRLFDACLGARGLRTRRRSDAFFAYPKRRLQVADLRQLPEHLDLVLERGLDRFARLLQPGPFLSTIPRPLVERWVRASLRLEAFTHHLAACTLQES